MIRRCLIWMVPLIVFGCTSSEKENSGTTENNGSITFVEKESGEFMPEEVLSNIASKRRSKLSNLTSDGESWFSFKIADPFSKVKITIANDISPAEFVWFVNGSNIDFKKNQFSLDSIDVNKGEVLLDIMITRKEITVFFNEGVESFVFKHEFESLDNKIKVELDGQPRDLPGILYDIGV